MIFPNCAKEKCAKILAELDCKKGIGLIEKKRQGLGKPDIIYVKNFVTLETEPEEVVQQRLEKAKKEMECIGEYKYVVCNDDIQLAADIIRVIIKRHMGK